MRGPSRPDRIDHENLIDSFRRILPELEPRCASEISENGERPSPYNFAGFVFKPLFMHELEKDTASDFLGRPAPIV